MSTTVSVARRGLNMLINVIYTDKSTGRVTPAQFERLLHRGVIAAFHWGNGWENPWQCILRRGDQNYSGPERRIKATGRGRPRPTEDEDRPGR